MVRSKLASKQLTISIVSFNTKALLKRCLISIFKHTRGLSFEVIVVDNASTDGSAQMVKQEFPRVRLIRNRVNRWYTGANNQALKLARGRYFMILNSDMYLTGNTFKTLTDYLEKNPQAAAVEPCQVNESGQVLPTGSRHNSWWLDLVALTGLHRWVKPRDLTRFHLSGRDRRQTWPAEVISDGAMLVRTKALKKIKGYDERFRLYYTENDLCRRLQGEALKVMHVGRAVIRHTVSASTDKAGWKAISPVFAADARQYYLKYHSRFQAELLYWAMRLNNLVIRGKSLWPWLSLVAVATSLRFYGLPDYLTFIGDMGRDYLAARDMVLTGVWPLTGIPSSIPWLHQGVLFIWATALGLKSGGFNPVTPAIMTATMGVVTVYLFYRLTKSWWAGLILATSPLAVVHSRLPYHLSPIPLATILYLWALSVNSIGWSIFLTGLLLQFELSTLPLAFLTLFWFRKQWRRLLLWAPVGLIPFLPKIIYDFEHGFTQTVGLVTWTGYRLVNYQQYGNAFGPIFEFWTKFISWGQPKLAAILGLWLLLTLRRQSKLLILSLGFILVGFYVHGAPSEGYFPVLFPVWAWLLARSGRWLKPVWLGLAVFNIFNLFGHNFYTYGPNLKQRLALVDTLPQSFRLVEYPQNPGWASYLDNYRYLIWWRGKDYQAESGPVYSIFDGAMAGFIQPLGTTVYHFSQQKLIRYDD